MPTPWEKDGADGSRQHVLFPFHHLIHLFPGRRLPADRPIEQDAAHADQMGEGSSVVGGQRPVPQTLSQLVRVRSRTRLSHGVKRPDMRSPRRISGSCSRTGGMCRVGGSGQMDVPPNVDIGESPHSRRLYIPQ